MKRYERRIEDKNYFILIMKVMIDIAVVAGVAIFLYMHLGKTVVVSGYSMENTLTNGDRIMLDKLKYALADIERFDVVVFSAGKDKGEFVKRIIGMPGEKIQIKNGKIYINGKVLKENMDTDSILNAGLAEDEILLGDDEYFVLGDNRNNSEDSRFETIGNIKKENIIGGAWFEVTGFTDFGWIE